MPQYIVLWLIDEEAETPRAAAGLARGHQHPTTSATIFDVVLPETATQEVQAWRVDLGSELDKAGVMKHDWKTAKALGRFLSERR